MERKLYAMEEWIYRAARRKDKPLPINFGIAIECEKLPEENKLRRALTEIENFFPFSRARVILYEDKRAILTTEDTSPIPVVFAEVSNVWEAIASEFTHFFDDIFYPLIRIFLYQSPQGAFLYAYFDHALMDGRGAIAWLKCLFALLEEDSPSSPPLFDWDTFVYSHFSPEWEKKYKKERPIFGGFFKSCRGIFCEPQWPQWHYHILTESFSSSLTQKIRMAAKNHSTSVHAALSMSFLQAFYEIGYGHKRPQRIVLSPLDLRPLYGLHPDTCGIFIGTLRTPVDFSTPESFWEKARFFKKTFDCQRQETDFLYFHYRAQKDLEKSLLHGFSKRRVFDTRKEYDLSLTNLGVIPYFSPNIRAIYGPIAQGLPTETVLGVSTYNNIMTLSWVSKPEFMPEMISRHIFKRGLEILLSHID